MTQQQLEKYLWGAATYLRGNIDAGSSGRNSAFGCNSRFARNLLRVIRLRRHLALRAVIHAVRVIWLRRNSL